MTLTVFGVDMAGMVFGIEQTRGTNRPPCRPLYYVMGMFLLRYHEVQSKSR
jgi:hypothetical protein